MRALASVFIIIIFWLAAVAEAQQSGGEMTMVIMDPLAAPLSCKCIAGYAQRDYDKLGTFLEKRLGRKVRVVYKESLAETVRVAAGQKVDLIIGKQSVVKSDAAEIKLAIRPLAMLTDKDGRTTTTGLFCVVQKDPAQKLSDLAGYKILFGPADSDEKHAAAVVALKKAGMAVPEKMEIRTACGAIATELVESKENQRVVGLISSYCLPLQEACGTVEKGSLRVVGSTAEVPFITLYATNSIDAAAEKQILGALRAVKGDAKLLQVLESKNGFDCNLGAAAPKSPDTDVKPTPKGKSRQAEWPGWRGPGRDGIVPWLPERLPAEPKIAWKAPLAGMGLSGIAVSGRSLLVADRDALDQNDIFRCLDAENGDELWKLEYPAQGRLDYGNSPRATPLIHDGRAYFLGAFGDLHCVTLEDGNIVWKMNIVQKFGAKLPKWGMTASPLIVDDKLIVNPGAKEASLVALDPLTGKMRWQSPGSPAAYSSFIVGNFGGVRQIVGYDADSLGGWEPATGKRLWSLVPPETGDFNVPTPIDAGGQLLVTSENNGTRLYRFKSDGRIVPEPAASYRKLAPDSSTPVLTNGKLFGCCADRLFCLDAAAGLKPLWPAKYESLTNHASFIATRERLLITTSHGELLLAGMAGNEYKLLSRVRVFGRDSSVLSHPALVGKYLYIRDESEIRCLALE